MSGATANPAPATARVVRAGDAAARVQPLYPATRLLRGAVFEAEKLAAEAAQMLGAAKAEAEQIRASAAADAAKVRQEGFAHGAEQAAADTAAMMRNLQTELDGLKDQFAKDVQRLAFKIAKVILGVEFDSHPERIVELVTTVLDRAKMYEKVTLRLHPDDVERVKPHVGELARGLTFAREVGLVGDPELPPHGVRVETEMGSFDGSIDVQLRRLELHLLGDAKGGSGGDDQAGGGS